MDRIVVIGSSGHAKSVIDAVERQGVWRIAGLIDRFRSPGDTTLGHPVLGGEQDVPALVERLDLSGAVIAIGDNFARQQVAAVLEALCPALPFVTVRHPTAAIGRDVVIGAGTVILAGVAVNPGSSIGRHCILNTHASLDHDSAMADFSSLGPAVVTGGHSRVGLCAAIGIGACLAHRVGVGEHSVIGAGATVLDPVAPFCVAYGTPARTVRSRAAGDPYL